MIEKDHILAEIRRTAAKNGWRAPLGTQRFITETGIRRADWYGEWFARSDVRRHGRLGSAIVRVWCFETFAALTNGKQDARRDSVLDL